MIKLRKCLALLISLSMFLCLFGCGNEKATKSFIYETVTGITNIDPLFAINDTELHIVYNTFEGLMKYDKAGILTCGVAENYSVSNGGKTYTFKLKKDAKWSDGRPLTANDFEFAFKRAVDPHSQSPYSSTLLPIKNVSDILKGKKSPDSISVKAINDSELEINLESVNTNFLDLLTTPVTMPCNEDFFLSCKGYYGLNKKSVLGNGYYRLSSWNEEYCGLKANEKYDLYNSSEIGTAYIYFNTEDELLENIKKEEPHFSVLGNTMIERLNDAEIAYQSTHIGNTVHSLIINPDSQLAEKNILNALSGTIEFEINDELKNKYGITSASSILPTTVNLSDKITFKNKTLNPDKALDDFIKGCENLDVDKIFPTFSIICLKDKSTETIARQIAANWQKIFGVTVNISAIEDEDMLKSQIISGYYDIAIISNTAISSSPTSYLQQFTSDSTTNISNFKNQSFDKTVRKMSKATGDEFLETTKEATKTINEYKYIYPLFVSSKTYYWHSELQPQFNPNNNIVYFSQIEFN